ncbi:hypothetical protein ACFSYD_02075 [Paracoccus aerius]
MRQFLSRLALAAALAAAPAPILAQNLFEPVIYINNAAITRYEVDQRQRFMQILGAPGTTAEEAQQALIDDRLRNHAARQLGIVPTEEGLQNGLEEFASRAGLSAAEFTAALENAGSSRRPIAISSARALSGARSSANAWCPGSRCPTPRSTRNCAAWSKPLSCRGC